jgi:Fibronectin type III domain
MAEKTITIAGKKIPQWAVYTGAGALIVGGILYFKNRNSSSSSSSTDPNAIDPVTGLPYSQDNEVDPLTGMTYLSEAQEFGSVAAAEAQYASDTSLASTGSGAVDTGSSDTGTTTGTTTTGTFTTNAQWAAQVESDLVDIGYSSSDVSAAIGRYLAGLSLTSDQAAIVQAGIGLDGPPPVNPPAINTAPSGGTSGGSGTVAGTPTTGTTTAAGGPITVTPVDLHVTHVYSTSAQVAWLAPSIPSGQGPLTGYTVEAYNSAGQTVNGPFTVSPGQLYGNIGGLKTKTTYHANVWCDPAKTGGPHATVSFTTT